MAKRTCRALAFCITVILAVTFAELTGTSATQEKHSKTHAAKRSTKKRVKSTKKAVRRRQTVSYVCPMHPDIRSKSRGTCPKCLMDLVAEKRAAKKE